MTEAADDHAIEEPHVAGRSTKNTANAAGCQIRTYSYNSCAVRAYNPSPRSNCKRSPRYLQLLQVAMAEAHLATGPEPLLVSRLTRRLRQPQAWASPICSR